MRCHKTIIAFFLIFPLYGWASTTICKVEEKVGAIKAITWDTETRKATIKDSFGDERQGMLTYSRQHSDSGNKVNIYLEYDEPFYGDDAAEFIVFPVSGGYRVIGTSYIIRSGKKYLNTLKGNYTATCLSM
jgi:hypothetical protein